MRIFLFAALLAVSSGCATLGYTRAPSGFAVKVPTGWVETKSVDVSAIPTNIGVVTYVNKSMSNTVMFMTDSNMSPDLFTSIRQDCLNSGMGVSEIYAGETIIGSDEFMARITPDGKHFSDVRMILVRGTKYVYIISIFGALGTTSTEAVNSFISSFILTY